MSKQKFFICRHCGNIIAYVRDSGVPVVCCGEKMQEIVPNTTEASTEKHIPEVSVSGSSVVVTVGSAAHPMSEEHHISWISLESREGNQRKELAHDGKPEAAFVLSAGDAPVAVYAYCNLHGLWKREVRDSV